MKLFSLLFTKLGVVFTLCVLWQSLAWVIASSDFPSLLTVLKSLHFHLTEGEMVSNLFITLKRALLSFIIAMVLGGLIGILMGMNSLANKLTDSLLIIMLNIPALVTILLCYIWIGLVETAAITAVVINKVPTVVVMIREGSRAVDQNLLAVAKIYKLSPSKTFFRVFLPQLYPFIIASARSGLSLIWKIVLVVELLGRSDGVGFALNTLFQFFDIAGILAYTIAFVIIILIIELLFFKPFDKVVARGKRFD
ncbi:ABC transporter permease subunit [Colwellia sp. 4_MG-2023]|uniref:ABC transporter permease n=1 Tax=unclassified Colwellia TaxID=196834 RepID=UPI0026E146B8|nr:MULTISPECIES: ABC transporter permease subunit [unclassified Colwellia]MDO6507334.1 ABC transporter permease subunit [Colwellia sp. 5_MG-2023]MDO6556067.1 ABC transporter permease subunit [Colwellia sp. 4_MG-2023]